VKEIMFAFLRDLSERHERLKERIHNTRIPLSPAGQRIMKVVYFLIPVVGGYYVMQLAIAQSHKNLGANGEKLRKPVGDLATLEQNRALGATLAAVKDQPKR
jgi:hypothetical protein